MSSFWFFFVAFFINFHLFLLKPLEICDEKLSTTTQKPCQRHERDKQIEISNGDANFSDRINSDQHGNKHMEPLGKEGPVTLSDIALDQLSKQLKDRQYDSNGVYVKGLVDQEKNSQISLSRVVNAGDLSEISANVGLDREQSNDRAFKSNLNSLYIATYGALNVRR